MERDRLCDDALAAQSEDAMNITGTISDTAGRGLAGYTVAAYHGDVNLKKEERLGTAPTNEDGTFSRPVSLAKYPLGVNVRVAVRKGAKEIWSSPVHYNVQTDLVVDATIPDASLGISDYRRLVDKITPLLQGAKLAELDPAQVAYLAGRSGLAEAQLNQVVAAAQLHDELAEAPEEALYGMLRQGLPPNAGDLAALPASDWKAALKAAARENVIAPQSKASEAALVHALNARKAAEVLHPISPLTAGVASFVPVALGNKGKEQRIAAIAARHDGVNGGFWRAVARDSKISAAERNKLQNYAALGGILWNDPGLLEQVAAHLTAQGEKVTPAALVTVDASTLRDLIVAAARANPNGRGDTLGGKRLRAYAASAADAIAQSVAAAYPTDALRAGLRAAPKKSYFGQYGKSLQAFFARNGDFDVRNAFDGSLGSFRGVPDQAAVKERLGTLARLYRALPGPEASFSTITVLADKGYRSSSAISGTPRTKFVADLSSKPEEEAYWTQVHDRATAVREVAWLKGIDLLHSYRQPFGVISRPRDQPATDGVADLRTLFGSLDMCECEACTSITSPAAYLADILNFLGTDVATAKTSPYEVLIARRPEIPHILLNCDNTNRPLPYIDLVNELLEDEVLRTSGADPVWWPYKRMRLQGHLRALLDDAASGSTAVAVAAREKLIQALRKELPAYDFDLDAEVSVITRQGTVGTRWHVFAGGWLVELSAASSDKLIEIEYISRQTFGTEAELAANPAFRSGRATRTLEAAHFPLTLPPGLPLLETRMFLTHLQVPRERVIKLLAPQEADGWAVEYLGLSAREADLITAPAAATLADTWGFQAATVTEDDVLVDPADSTKLLTGPWSQLMRRVDVLIARAGITYVQLLDLLGTDFVNPPLGPGLRPISIQSIDGSDPATCDLSKLRIAGYIVTPASGKVVTHVVHVDGDIGAPGDFLDRLARFLRLERRTGWSARELDMAIRQVAPGVLEPNTLRLLAALKWTKNALRLTHAEACALFGAIDTTRYVDHAADGQPTIPSQYDELFQNRAITTPVDPGFALNDAGDKLRDTSLSPATSAAKISAAFQIGEADVAMLAKRAGVSTLSVETLSDLYRRVLFARGFKLSIQEMVWLEQLAGTLPAADDIPAFVERVECLRGSKLSVADAWFLLHGDDAATAYLAPGDDEVAQTLGDLGSELRKIAAEHQLPDPVDTDGALLRRRLGELNWGAPLIDDLLGAVCDTKLYSVRPASLPATVNKLLNPSPGDPVGVPLSTGVGIPAGVEALIAYDSATQRLRATRLLSRADRKKLLLASSNANFREAVELLFALGKLTYAGGTLACRGLLPAAGVTELLKLAPAQSYKDAIQGLADLQRQVISQKLRYGTLPVYEIDLGPTSLDLPPELAAYVYYDATQKKLVIRGRLTRAEQDALERGATPSLPQAALDALPTPQNAGASAVNVAELSDLLATTAQVGAVFDPPTARDMPATTAEIAAVLLAKLTPHARDVLSRRATVNSLSTALGLAASVTQDLVERRLPSATGRPHMVDAFLALATDDPRAPVDSANHAQLFDDYRRLSKIALLFQRLTVEEAQVPWLFDYAPAATWLSASNLTSGAAAGSTGLVELSELVRLMHVAGRSPYSVTLIDDVLQDAKDPASAKDPATGVDDLIGLIHDNSLWSRDDLSQVSQDLSLSAADDFISAKALEDLWEAMTAIGQLGATASEAVRLTASPVDDDVALLAKSLAKSKHDPDHWPDVVKPINDTLREARRAALVDYLIANPRRAAGSGYPLWHDADSLYDYMLVDVEMGACMTTSRIRLALSSAQLFVQRCLMNLEAPRVTVSDDPRVRQHWNEWETWRKLYRVWDGNRKIFLYPENWLEPELRDDKTPFFTELENELLQNDVTKETAEKAFLNYLHKLDGVSKLEVMGIFVEEEDVGLAAEPPPRQPGRTPSWPPPPPGVAFGATTDGSDQTASIKRSLHVVARTSGDPQEWFYRKLTTTGGWSEGIWSPWEKIDADITGDHVLPVVWNHHLYLFWAQFERKAAKATAKELADKNPHEPRHLWRIKFAWSEYKDGRWSPKRVSKDSLDTPAGDAGDPVIDESAFSFKTEVGYSSITIRCYGPKLQDPTDETTATQPPPPEGYRLIARKANCAIYFYDKYGQWDTNVTVLVYRNGTKVLTLESRTGNGYVGIWENFGPTNNNQWWRDSEVDIRTRENLYQITPVQPIPSDSTGAHLHATLNNYDPLYTVVQEVDSVPSSTSGNGGSQKTDDPGLVSVEPAPAMAKIGYFTFQVCRGELSPTAQQSDETIPDLEAGGSRQSTKLSGMMYVETGLDSPFLGGVLGTTRGGRYRVVMPHQNVQPDTSQPFFFQDDSRVFLVTQSRSHPRPTRNGGTPAASVQYRFDVFYHPYVCEFIARVNRKGVGELLTLQSQALDDLGAVFGDTYSPSTQVQVVKPVPDGKPVPVTREYVDFDRSGAYSIYNWELFFHVPLLIATKLTANQRFEEARQWLHFIFDPTTRPGAFKSAGAIKPTQRFWNVRPFWEIEGRDIHSIDQLLRGPERLSEQYTEWREDPFKPYVVARLRQAAFMQSVVMRYLDNLLEWGDRQFSLFTMESTNEATLLYVLAAEILGRRPETIPPRARPAPQTYSSLEQQASGASGSAADTWRNFSDLMVEIEAYISPAAVPAGAGNGSALGRMWAFCVPSNGNLLQYWTRVTDRLFKLRHCQDIEGAERKIPLWDPPIDPALLVRAAAAGVDLASVLTDVNAALPNYRFSTMLAKALELCAQVKSFGAELLSGLEKKDGEELGRLRSQQEIDLLNALRDVKKNQLAENTQLRLASEKSKVMVEARRDYYRDIPFLIPAEQAGLALSAVALNQETVAAASDTLAAIAAWFPQFSGGTSGFYSSPVVVTTYGGEQASRGASAAASQARSIAAVLSGSAAASQTAGGYQRRQDEWTLQETLANKELDQIDKQIAAGEIREALAQADLDAHDRQTDNAKAIDEHLRSKYTNTELYSWMQGQLSGLYFQAYKLAFDVAKKTERSFRHELGLDDSDFVRFGYWDNLKSGLLAGERLENDLRRMEAAYLDQNRREFEITKHVSLAVFNPGVLATLKAVGACEVDIPEWLYDMDYPGHYMRRIKSVSLSIPCVTGRYTNVNCTMTQSFSKVRTETIGAEYDDPSHFHENFGSTETIVTSTARQDSGLFELNFRDERYLPFEGTGAIGRWRIELPPDENRFDLATVSDVILHIHYTARDGGQALREAARAATSDQLKTGVRAFDARTEFASDWYRFKNPENGHDPKLTLQLGNEHFPLRPAHKSVDIQSVELICAANRDAGSSLALTVAVGSKSTSYALGAGSGPGELRSQEKKIGVSLGDIVISGKAADVAGVEDLLVVCHYSLS